jgi:hypothetical protein
MKLALLFLAFVAACPCKGQAIPRSKIILIDTLLGQDKYWMPFSILACLDTNETSHLRDTIIEAYIEKKGKVMSVVFTLYRFYQTEFYNAPKEVQLLDLPFDGNDGVVSIKDIWNIKADTIRISKWTIYNNGLPDTAFRGTLYQDMINDSVQNSNHVVDTTRYVNRGRFNIHKATVNINGVIYTIRPIKHVRELRRHSHGYLHRKAYYRYRKSTNSKKKYRYIRFNRREIIHHPYFNAQFYLNS